MQHIVRYPEKSIDWLTRDQQVHPTILSIVELFENSALSGGKNEEFVTPTQNGVKRLQLKFKQSISQFVYTNIQAKVWHTISKKCNEKIAQNIGLS